MRTAFIQVVRAAGGEYEARLAVDWDGLVTPGPNAPRVSFAGVPAPPGGSADWVNFLLQTNGASAELHTLGCQLYDLVITGEVRTELERARADGPLRLLIKIEPPELDALPWELMRNGSMLMFTNASLPVARVAPFFDPAIELPQMVWPLRVLLVVGSEDEEIHVEEELRYITDGFRKVCGLVDLKVIKCPDRDRVRSTLEEMKPHVLHFIGHGGLDDQLGGYLRLEQDGAASIQWTATAIRDDLAFAVPRLVVLNACQYGLPDEHDGTRAAAQGLTELRVPAVITMQGPIRGRSAARFAKGLYETLSSGGPLDRAVTRARVEITTVAPQNQRDYALPALFLGAPPERILDVSRHDPSQALPGGPLTRVLSFVDRVDKRLKLWDGLWADGPSDKRIFVITGPVKAGKGSLVRWCLGVASVLGHPTVLAEINSGDGVDSVGLLDALVKAQVARAEVAAALAGLTGDVLEYRLARQRANDLDQAYDKSPLYLYKKLTEALAAVTAQRTLLIGIDGLAGVEPGMWVNHVVPGLVQPIARGLAGNVRLVLAVQENEFDQRFPGRYLDLEQVAKIPIKLFPAADFADLTSQRLRALGYPREVFDETVQSLKRQIKQPEWSTDYFDLVDLSARVGGWERE